MKNQFTILIGICLFLPIVASHSLTLPINEPSQTYMTNSVTLTEFQGYVTGITECTFGLSDGCYGSNVRLFDRNEHPIVLGNSYLIEAGGFTGCGRQVYSIKAITCP